MEILGQGGERISGVWTGGVKTKVHTAGLTIPLMATYKLSNRWNIKAGPLFLVSAFKRIFRSCVRRIFAGR